MPLLDVQRRLTELGRIRLGEKGPKGEPRRLSHFRLTSASKTLLDAAAKVYGGVVRKWSGAPDEGMWELYTTSDELDILVPPTLASYSQAYELWDAGGCSRRCDGVKEAISGGPCLCDPDARECQVTTRVSVMLPKIPGIGVWRLDSKGWNAAAELPGTLDVLVAMAAGGTYLPAVLRVENRSSKRHLPGGKVQTRRFPVPVIVPIQTMGELMAAAIVGTAPAPQIEPVNRRERVARPELPAGDETPIDEPFVRPTAPFPEQVEPEGPAFAPPPEVPPPLPAGLAGLLDAGLSANALATLCVEARVTKTRIQAALAELGTKVELGELTSTIRLMTDASRGDLARILGLRT